jgi:AhpD family alkylhydroperoxidase
MSAAGRLAILANAGRDAMDKLDEITRKRKEAHAKLLSLKSRVYEAFLRLEEAAFSDGALPKKMKELIAVGISVKSDCESCMQWHIEQAAGAGATLREVLEAVEVGIEMGGGPATVSARFALEVIERVFPDQAAGGGV